MNKLNSLSRAEMKKVMGGLLERAAEGGCATRGCSSDSDCGGNCPKCVEVNPTWGTICATSVVEEEVIS